MEIIPTSAYHSVDRRIKQGLSTPELLRCFPLKVIQLGMEKSFLSGKPLTLSKITLFFFLPPSPLLLLSNSKTRNRETSPLFAVYYHRHYTRKDSTTIFNMEEFAKKNGNGKMPVDAFFHEVAFKQGKMPKYPQQLIYLFLFLFLFYLLFDLSS